MTHFLLLDVHVLQHAFDLMARGGGGGSGGGGGGGGDGIIVLLGYLPAHYIGSRIRKKSSSLAAAITAITLSTLYGIAWWFAGSFGFFVSLGAFVGGPAGFYGWFGQISAKIRGRAKKQIAAAASKDPAWNEEALHQYVVQVFQAFQSDWSTFNGARLQQYLTPHYAYHMQLVLHALQLRKRRNDVNQPRILEAFPIDVTDADNDEDDSVTFYISATANDRLLETIEGNEKQVYVDNRSFAEYWRFVRSGNTWLLDGILQTTENALSIKHDIQLFAQNNSMYYSADWGWLLLPSRGQLFGSGKFGTSDINNHVIGVYRNLLVELYTYVPDPRNGTDIQQFVIAQVALPKRYDSLIVEAKSGLFGGMMRRTPRGYNKLTLEWPDFNKRYNVFATNVEQVTAFELLHPVYMEKLFALPFKVSIEVVDNVVYLYTKDKKADYGTMYSILQDAFEEMRL